MSQGLEVLQMPSIFTINGLNGHGFTSVFLSLK